MTPFELNLRERAALETLTLRTNNAKLLRRALTLLWLDDGESAQEVAERLSVSRQSVYNWVIRFQLRNGLDIATRVADGLRSGRPRRLSNDQLNTLSELLTRGATAHGWQNELWTAKRVTEVIRRHFGIEFSVYNVRRVLKDHLRWTVQRPIQREKKRDEAEIRRWKEQLFPQIVRDARLRGADIVFVDEAGFMAAPTRRQTLAPRGKTPVLKVTDPHGRISVAGTITISPIKRRLSFLYHLLPNNVNFHGDLIVQFLKEISCHIRGPMILLWDGISIHSSDPVIQYLEQHSRITVKQLPAYAHELNPVDKGWLYIKYDCLANYAPTTLDELRSRLIQELDALRKKPKVLAWCIEQAGLKTRLDVSAA